MIKIIINGRVPSKKNSRVKYKNGSVGTSDNYKKWHRDATIQLSKQCVKREKLVNRTVTLEIFYPDMRVADNTNKAESVMDLLVDYGVIKDDSWQIIPSVTINGSLDRENPRVEVSIY